MATHTAACRLNPCASAHNNGATTKEIVEVFVQVAVYCGVPASNTAMRLCVEVFRERGVLRKA
jgi:alkylhydroperoxidase/carboxymuconolactone decarboxylase family protein YurZ